MRNNEIKRDIILYIVIIVFVFGFLQINLGDPTSLTVYGFVNKKSNQTSQNISLEEITEIENENFAEDTNIMGSQKLGNNPPTTEIRTFSGGYSNITIEGSNEEHDYD